MNSPVARKQLPTSSGAESLVMTPRAQFTPRDAIVAHEFFYDQDDEECFGFIEDDDSDHGVPLYEHEVSSLDDIPRYRHCQPRLPVQFVGMHSIPCDDQTVVLDERPKLAEAKTEVLYLSHQVSSLEDFEVSFGEEKQAQDDAQVIEQQQDSDEQDQQELPMTPTNPALIEFFASSPRSPGASLATLEDKIIPLKHGDDLWLSSSSFCSYEQPDRIMTIIDQALGKMKCTHIQVSNRKWNLEVRALCVAEEIVFRICLFQLQNNNNSSSQDNSSAIKYQVDFVLVSGSEMNFFALVDFLRMECNEIDAEQQSQAALCLLAREDPDLLQNAFFDGTQQLGGCGFALKRKDAQLLLEEMATLGDRFYHEDHFYEVAKHFKNVCRCEANRQLFLDLDTEKFLQALKRMLQDGNDEIARFAVFILLHFTAKAPALTSKNATGVDVGREVDAEEPVLVGLNDLFGGVYEAKTFRLLVEQLCSDTLASEWTKAMSSQLLSCF